jgi:hypothetical protein
MPATALGHQETPSPIPACNSPTGGKMRKAEHCRAGGADDQGFGKAGERIAQ